MKTLVVLTLVVVAASAQATLGNTGSGTSATTGGNAGLPKPKDWGPKVFGMGANNPWAIPPHPWVMQRALAVANMYPSALVRLDVDGEVQLTDQYGRDLNEVHGPYGQEIDLDFEF